MLKEQVEKLDCLRNSERIDNYINVKCFIKPEKKFNIYIFTNIYETEVSLKNSWNDINNDIAFFFQSKLEKVIERWNLYIIYFVKQPIDKKLKYEIEQNKYCARKLVIDNFDLDDYEKDLKKTIMNKIFDISLGNKKEYTYKSMIDLIEEHDEYLLKLLLTPNSDISHIIEEYLKGDSV